MFAAFTLSAVTRRVHCVSVFVERSLSLSLRESQIVACTVVAPLTYGCLLIHEGKREAASPLRSTCHIFSTLFNTVTFCPTDDPFLRWVCVSDRFSVNASECVHNYNPGCVFKRNVYTKLNGTFAHKGVHVRLLKKPWGFSAVSMTTNDGGISVHHVLWPEDTVNVFRLKYDISSSSGWRRASVDGWSRVSHLCPDVHVEEHVINQCTMWLVLLSTLQKTIAIQ